jgi:hypothetical protein
MEGLGAGKFAVVRAAGRAATQQGNMEPGGRAVLCGQRLRRWRGC